MLKDATTEQERTLLRKNIAQIAANLSEDDALVLTFLFLVHKNGDGKHFATAKEIIARTRIQRTKARMSSITARSAFFVISTYGSQGYPA